MFWQLFTYLVCLYVQVPLTVCTYTSFGYTVYIFSFKVVITFWIVMGVCVCVPLSAYCCYLLGTFHWKTTNLVRTVVFMGAKDES